MRREVNQQKLDFRIPDVRGTSHSILTEATIEWESKLAKPEKPLRPEPIRSLYTKADW